MVKLNLDFPEKFFEPEEICGHYVSKEMKELWAVELDLLKQFDDVCKKYDLKYYASFGTLLGAARHKGFIPWDDDIDVVMSREEFKKLCKVPKEEFKEPYFFQTEYTEPGSHNYFGKLRNSDTTALLKLEPGFTFNQGIFIDIFPMDNIPDDEEEHIRFKKRVAFVREIGLLWSRAYETKAFRTKYFPFYIIVYGTKWFIRLFKIRNPFIRLADKLAQKYNHKETKRWSNLTVGDSYYFTKEYFDDIVYLDFENLKVPCPKRYDEALTERYGNWREFVKGTELHTITIMDTSKSYKEYV